MRIDQLYNASFVGLGLVGVIGIILGDAYYGITIPSIILFSLILICASHRRGDIRIWPKNFPRDNAIPKASALDPKQPRQIMNYTQQKGGRPFERHVGYIFQKRGYAVELTPITGDYGADLILTKDGKRIAVQVKFSTTGKIGQGAVREVNGSLKHYEAKNGWVVTNSDFTPHGRQLAKDNNIRLINGDELRRIEEATMRGEREQTQLLVKHHHIHRVKKKSNHYYSRHQEYRRRN